MSTVPTMDRANTPNGVLVINKPSGPTSHDLVQDCRKALGRGSKVGHTGTLDPFASGVLVMVVGQASRLARYFQNSEKEYLAKITLGQETDTYDREGEIMASTQVPPVASRNIESVLNLFRGPIQQIPPMYSAIKIRGERLYKKARRNEHIERPPRDVNIHEIELISESEESLQLRIRCSPGTYIRSLAHDLGRKIGCGAHLSSLIRTRSGPFTIENSCTVEEIAQDSSSCLIPMFRLLPEIPSVELNLRESEMIKNGRTIKMDLGAKQREFRLLLGNELIAIAAYDGEKLHPRIVFPPVGP